MANNFKLNKAGMKKLEQEAARRLKPQSDEQIQDIVRGVRDGMNRQPSSKVYAELVKRVRAAGFEPNTRNLQVVAREIETGTLKD
ncbi:hypothetical protein [Arthrobacter sp. VKM Ac-2550]|uniref:hypothetical protein n=1 Tax=Crystallibacter permensis TaxID=1938888 RepID=UPI002225C38D|nr:hypothetical protein [Arthrobacter sp. VKM Ac-2550]MCW2131716.1 hypothetical protein [Arthrobacter sp. VKM Ac-2550]